MNILFLTTHFNTGGITSYILTLSKELAASGHNVRVISSGGNMVQELEKIGGEHFVLNIRTKSFLSWKLFAAVPRVKEIVKDQGTDVIHAHTRVTQFLACLISRLTGVPYITTCHGFFRSRWIRKIFPCWGKNVIAISEQVADHLEEDFKVAAEDITLIRNGIDLELFRPATRQRKDSRHEESGYAENKIVGIVARLSDVKGHCVLIDAINIVRKEISGVKLLIVGKGREEARLKVQVENLHLQDHVVFYPVVNQMIEFLALFDCFVLPSLQEGLGLSVMEAQAGGLPVIASRVGGIPSLIEDGETGLLVEAQDSEMLAKAIVRILKDSALAQKLGMKAREKAEREYGSDQMAEKILKVYKDVVSQGFDLSNPFRNKKGRD